MKDRERKKRRRARVLLVGPGRRSPGGVQLTMEALARSPLAANYEMRLVATHRLGSAGQKLAQAARGIARTAYLLARGWPDLVWLHAAADVSFWRKGVVVGLARLFHVPCVMHLHGGTFVEWHRALPPPARRAAERILANCDLVITLSPVWRERLSSFVRSPLIAVMNPVDIPVTSSRDARVEGRVLFLGRLGDHKGTPVLIRALSLLRAEGVDATAVLAGDGDHAATAAEVERLNLGGHVELLRWVGREEVVALLESASVLALPSRGEGLPLAVLEAMAHAVPVVVTPVGGIPDIVEPGRSGLFVEPDDPASLAAALRAVLRDRGMAETMGTAGRASIEDRCSTTTVAAQIDQAFRQVLARRR